MNQKPHRVSKTLIVSIIVIVIVAALIVGGLFVWRTYFQKDNSAPQQYPAPTSGFVDGTQVFISWPKVEGATGYTLQCSLTNDFSKDPITVETATSTSSCTDVIPGKTYYIRYAVTSGGNLSGWSKVLERFVPVQLATPAGLTANVLSPTEIALQWSAVEGTTNYEVQRSTNAEFTKDVVTLSSSEATNTFIGLTPKTTYYFHVRALDGGPVQNTTPYSSPITATTSAK